MSSASIINVIFVLPEKIENETSASPKMWQTYNACKANDLKVRWLKADLENIEETTKTDIVVFDEFRGAFFDKVLASKSIRVVSPQCLLHCLNDSLTIPKTLTKTALRSIALLNCCVVVSNLPKDVKIEMKRKIQAMGGTYSNDLVSDTTHLITNSVKSEKFIAAVERGIKVMLVSFIETLWEQSENRAVHATNDEFAKYVCPVFYNLTICSTGFTRSETNIPQLVADNGGKFSFKMIPKETDVLICKTTASDKYKFAVKGRVSCVTENWIFDSIARSYALPNHADYAVKAETSTPTKSDVAEPNFSMLSEIGRFNSQSVMEVDETLQQSYLKPSACSSKGKKRLSDEFMNQLDVKRAKLAGPFLDGCVVYLGGFSVEEIDRLVKIINYSGAIRSDGLNSRVTHAIFHNSQEKDIQLIADNDFSCVAVTTQWLVDSMNAKSPVDVDSYLISRFHESPGNNSPLSRKGITMLRGEVQPEERNKCENIEEQEEIMKRYRNPVETLGQSDMDAALAAFTLQAEQQGTLVAKTESNNASSPSISVSTTINASIVAIFAQLKFAVVNFTPGDEENEIINYIQQLQGSVVPKHYKGVPDYAVVPICHKSSLQITATVVVTCVWIKDCVEQERLITDLDYYHLPFTATRSNILQEQVISLSGFTKMEKMFWKAAIEEMGGIHQDCMARITNRDTNTVRTTHLVATEASGKKYQGALKWGVPVVNKEWLFACNQAGCLVGEVDFLLGDNTDDKNASRSIQQTAVSTEGSSLQRKCESTELRKIKTRLEFATPTSSPTLNRLKANEVAIQTPPMQDCRRESLFCSQMTPVSEIIARVRGIQTEDSKTPTNKAELNASQLPGGNLTPEVRIKWDEWLKHFPSGKKSTPLYEIKRRFWANFNVSTPPQRRQLQFQASEDAEMRNVQETQEQSTQDIAMEKLLIEQLGQLEDEIKSSNCTPRRQSAPKRAPNEASAIPEKESQPEFVGWDENMDINSPRVSKPNKMKMFMISGVDADTRTEYVEKLGKLGGFTSVLANFDPSATHLLCEKLNRNEKFLASLAAGLWILNVSYLEDSIKAGKLLDEQEYEFGNPKAKFVVSMNNEEVQRAAACFYWRDEVQKRGYGAFHDIRAIIEAEKKDPMVRVLSAGGAVIVDAKPPFDRQITATHCFLEAKNPNLKQYVPLAEQGILCLNTLYVNGFLNRTMKNINEYILPSFHKYY